MDLDELNEKYKKMFKRYVLKSILNSRDGEYFLTSVDKNELDRILEDMCRSEYFRDFCFDDFHIIHIDIMEGIITTKPASVFNNLPSVKMRKK